jgi:hypothetical protein
MLGGKTAGYEAQAMNGASVQGKSLTVVLQRVERTGAGLRVWLTIENDRGQGAVRWFGPEVTVYPTYDVLRPDLSAGSHFIFDLYPGNQNTACYSFSFPSSSHSPKFMLCKSWDDPLSFWWARGA